MPNVDHILERRAKLLSSRLLAHRDTIRNAVAPEGQRLPFTEQLSKPSALGWWKLHRYDDLGQQVTARMKPEQVMELDQALTQANEEALNAGVSGQD